MQTTIDFDPPSNGRDTSNAAATMIKPHAATLRERIYAFIWHAGVQGATIDEIVQALGLPVQTVCGRVNELHNEKFGPPRIGDSRRRRPTRSGAKATAWWAVEFNHLNQE